MQVSGQGSKSQTSIQGSHGAEAPRLQHMLHSPSKVTYKTQIRRENCYKFQEDDYGGLNPKHRALVIRDWWLQWSQSQEAC